MLMDSSIDVVVSIFTGTRAGLHNCRHVQCAHPATGFLKLYFLLLLISLLFTGCASVPKDYTRTQSEALTNHLDTSAGRFFEEAAVLHPDESGFAIIRRGHQAFTSRIALAGMAKKTPDLQYYVWEKDETGDLVWVTEIDGGEVRYDDEPETTFGQRFMSDFISIMPVEDHL
jgi:hypothetical protein